MTTDDELEAIRELDRLYVKALESGRDEDWAKYWRALDAFEQRRSA